MIRAGIERDCPESLAMIPAPIRESVLEQFKSLDPKPTDASLHVRILGLGRVGESLRHTFAEFGVPTVVWSRRLGTLVEHLRDDPPVKGQTILITVSDPAIDAVAAVLAPFLDDTQVVLHCAGARAPVRIEGLDACRSGVLHPIRAIPNGQTSLTHQVWGISGGEAAQDRARSVIELLEGEYVQVPREQAVLYHAAMVIAGNFPLALQAVSESVLSTFSAQRDVSRKALQTLHLGALRNVADSSVEAALTGPVARRDLATIQAHLEVLSDVQPELAEWYRRTTILLANHIGWRAGVTQLERH